MAAAKPKRTAFEWGARSAIQKAIRRSDGPMLRQAVDVLWRIEPSWLFWRMPILAAEEVPQLTGLACDTAKKAQELRKEKKFDEAFTCALEILQKICSYKKDKTPWAIVACEGSIGCGNFPCEPNFIEEEMRKRWCACKLAIKMINENHGENLWRSLLQKAEDNPENIQSIVKGAYFRFSSGGMDFDRKLLAVTAILALGEYTDNFEDSMQDELVSVDVARTGDWPWYCYDMHTLVGKRVLSYLSKKYKMDQWTISDLWFNFESNRLARGGVEIGFWYSWFMKNFRQFRKMDQALWDKSVLRKDMIALIPKFAAA